MYFEARGATDEAKQHSIFLASVGTQTYQLIKNLLVYGKLSDDKSYKELTDLISKEKNGCHFADDILKTIFLSENREDYGSVKNYESICRSDLQVTFEIWGYFGCYRSAIPNETTYTK